MINKTAVLKLSEVISLLKKNREMSLNEISRTIRSDNRTLKKMLISLEKLKLINIENNKIGKRSYYKIKLRK